MYVEHVLGAEDAKANEDGDEAFDVIDDSGAALRFLDTRPTARILIIIDTHCLENGYFTYIGNNPVAYETCSLLEVCPIP